MHPAAPPHNTSRPPTQSNFPKRFIRLTPVRVGMFFIPALGNLHAGETPSLGQVSTGQFGKL